MKPGSFKGGRILLALAVVGTTIALISWDSKQQSPNTNQDQYYVDTVPKNKNVNRDKKVRDLDEALERLEEVNIDIEIKNAMKEVEIALKELDGEKIRLQVMESMKGLDMEKMQKELKESMAKLDIDLAKMEKELKVSLKELDSKEMQIELEKALKEVDVQKIQKEVQESLSKMNLEKMQKDLEIAKNIDLSKIDKEIAEAMKELELVGPNLEKELKNAKVEIEKAKDQMKEFKVFVDGLDKDGLIKKSGEYSIRHENGELMINGKKASDATYLKYKSFLEKNKKFNIEKSEDDFDMDMD
jgi:hypothetical protein